MTESWFHMSVKKDAQCVQLVNYWYTNKSTTLPQVNICHKNINTYKTTLKNTSKHWKFGNKVVKHYSLLIPTVFSVMAWKVTQCVNFLICASFVREHALLFKYSCYNPQVNIKFKMCNADINSFTWPRQKWSGTTTKLLSATKRSSEWVSRGLTSHSTLYRSFRGRFLQAR